MKKFFLPKEGLVDDSITNLITPYPNLYSTSWRDPNTQKEHKALVLRDNKGRQVMLQYPHDNPELHQFDLDPMRLLTTFFFEMATAGKTKGANDFLDKYHVQIQTDEEV